MQDVKFKSRWSHWTPEKTIDFEPGEERVTNEIAEAATKAGVLEATAVKQDDSKK